MSYNMKQLRGEGAAMLRKNLQRDFDPDDLLQLMMEEDRTEAILTALYAGYALGYQHAVQDRESDQMVIPFPVTGKPTD